MKNWIALGLGLFIFMFTAAATTRAAHADDAPFDKRSLQYGTSWWCDTGETAFCHRTLAICKNHLTGDGGVCEKQDSAYAFAMLAPKLTKIAIILAIQFRTAAVCREMREGMLAAGADFASACAKVGAKPPPRRPTLPKAKQYWCFGSGNRAVPSACGESRQRCERAVEFTKPLVNITFECELRTRVWTSYSRVDGDVPAFAISVSKQDCEMHRNNFGLDGELCIQLGRKKGPDDPAPAYK